VAWTTFHLHGPLTVIPTWLLPRTDPNEEFCHMSWFDGLLKPIMVVVAWIMVQFHALFSAIGLDPASGAAWALSIVGLVIVIRIALIPLFFRQIKASRGMQLIAPQMQAIQKKYKGKTDPASREAMQRETMALYRENGTNPFASCLPILLQSPIFFALFRVLIELPGIASGKYPPIGPMTPALAAQAEAATIFGAPLSGTFMQAGDNWHIRVVSAVLIIAMSATTFLTQRQLTMKNMPPAALQGPMAQQQKVLLYVLPLIFAFSGVNFPIGVLIYWTTTNLWSMGQQFYTIRRMPAPGSQAEIAMKERKARKAATHAPLIEDAAAAPTLLIEEKPRSGQRQQPKRKDRNKPRVVTDDVTNKPETSSDDEPDGPSTPAPAAPTKPKK
jgi:YidC/Oxa1 family membrane protein insertase